MNVHVLTITGQGRMRDIKTPARIAAAIVPGAAAPVLQDFQAIWDTGATSTCISQKVVDMCGLTPTGMVQMHTASGVQNTPVFLICMRLPGGVGFTPLRVSLVTLTGADVLIGMDVITQGDFALTNAGGRTMFSFRYPPDQHIDFHAPLKAIVEAGGGTVKTASPAVLTMPAISVPKVGVPGVNPNHNRKQRRDAQRGKR